MVNTMYLSILKLLRTIRLWVVILVCSTMIILLKHRNQVFHRAQRTLQKLNINLMENERKEDKEKEYFLKYWKLQHERRFEFDELIKPCQHDIQWLSYYPNRNASQITSAKTSQVFMDIRPTGQYNRIVITSYNLLNSRKYIGGDSWRILIHGKSSVPVTKVDNLDGTYEMSFLITESGSYRIELFLEYTLCDGYKDPPPDWFKRGNEQGKGQLDSVLPSSEKPYLEEQYYDELSFVVQDGPRNIYKELLPKLQNLKHPKCLMWNGFGSWNTKNFQWKPYLPKPYQMKSENRKELHTGLFWIYGDSIGDFFFRAVWNTQLCKHLFKTCKRSYNWSYILPHGKPPSKTTFPYDNKDFDIDRIIHELSNVISTLSKNPQSVLLLNLGLHYAMGISIKKFDELMDKIIETLLKYQNKFNGTVIWKTNTAIQKWKYGSPTTNARFAKSHRFLTQQRNELFNSISMKKLCDAGIHVLDVLPISCSYPNGTGTVKKPWDAVHYDRTAFLPVELYLTSFFKPK